MDSIKIQISIYLSHNQFGCILSKLLTTPIFINFTFKLLSGCPPGLTLDHSGTECSCYPVLSPLYCNIDPTSVIVAVIAQYPQNISYAVLYLDGKLCYYIIATTLIFTSS